MVKCIMIRVGEGIDEILSDMAKKLGKKKGVIARELMEQKLNEMSLISQKVKGK